ncbi:MAG: hypothetical protein IJF32_00515 [Oscillospiraceae bacterium]|nr:hypothetical protein [Oscillospiraceae bacterium]
MTNSKATRKAFFMSMLSLLLCFTMLMGATFAWFTDTVTSTNNIIKSGNLDIELYYQLEGESADKWTKVTESSNIFKEDALWEPGYTEVVRLKAVNEGSLALKYQLGVNVVNEITSTNVNGGELKLSDHIKFGLIDGNADGYDRDDAIAAVDAAATELAEAYTSDVISLYPEKYTGDDASATYPQEKVVTLVVYMPTTVDNVANHAKDADVPKINLGLNVSATQLAAEMDSFDNTYDEGAYLSTVMSAAELKNALADGKSVKLGSDIAFTEGIVLADNVSIDGNGHTITYSGTDYDYQLVKLNTGAEIKNVTLKNYRVRTESAANGVVTLQNVVINMDNDLTGLDVSAGAGTAKLTNVECKSITDETHLDPDTQVQVDYTPYGDVILGGAWALEATGCDFGSLHGWNTRNGSNVSLNNTSVTVFRMHYWSNRTLYIDGVETAWSESGAIPVAHDVGGCWSVQPAFK